MFTDKIFLIKKDHFQVFRFMWIQQNDLILKQCQKKKVGGGGEEMHFISSLSIRNIQVYFVIPSVSLHDAPGC